MLGETGLGLICARWDRFGIAMCLVAHVWDSYALGGTGLGCYALCGTCLGLLCARWHWFGIAQTLYALDGTGLGLLKAISSELTLYIVTHFLV